MKRTLFLLVIFVAALFVLPGSTTTAVPRQFAEKFVVNGETSIEGESGTYNFDPAHTFIGFRVRHLGLIDVPGYFRDFTGSINYDAKDASKSSVTFTAKVTSVDTGVQGRDNHLRRADFFEVEKYPEMTFKSTKVEKKGDNWMVTGDLTIKETTRSVTFPFKIAGFLPANQRSGARMGVTAETMLNRRDFGVDYDSKVPGTETQVVGDNIKVWLQIEAIKPREEAKPEGE
jgi:polyisoprenoid-binding protein YceI